MKTILKSIFAILLSGAIVNAQVPPLLNIQGRLTDPNGINRPNGPVQMTFRIYDQFGTKLWEETQTAVNITAGIFTSFLGQEPLGPGGAPLESVFNGQDRFLEIQVASDPPMVPRQRMVSVPFALHSERAEKLGNNVVIISPSGNVGIGTASPAAKLDISDGSAAVLNITKTGSGAGVISIIEDGSQPRLFGPSGSNFYLGISGDAVGAALTLKPGGNVGIGMTNPLYKLHVEGPARVGGSSGTQLTVESGGAGDPHQGGQIGRTPL